MTDPKTQKSFGTKTKILLVSIVVVALAAAFGAQPLIKALTQPSAPQENTQRVETKAVTTANRPNFSSFRAIPPNGFAISYKPLSDNPPVSNDLVKWSRVHAEHPLLNTIQATYEDFWRTTLRGVNPNVAFPSIESFTIEGLTHQTADSNAQGWRGFLKFERGISPIWESLRRRGEKIKSPNGFDEAFKIGERPVIGLLKGDGISWANHSIVGAGVITETPDQMEWTWRVGVDKPATNTALREWISKAWPQIDGVVNVLASEAPWLVELANSHKLTYLNRTSKAGVLHEALHLNLPEFNTFGLGPINQADAKYAVPGAATVIVLGLDGTSNGFISQIDALLDQFGIKWQIEPILAATPRGTIVFSAAPEAAGTATPWPVWSIDLPTQSGGLIERNAFLDLFGDQTLPEEGTKILHIDGLMGDMINAVFTPERIRITNSATHAQKLKTTIAEQNDPNYLPSRSVEVYAYTGLYMVHNSRRWLTYLDDLTKQWSRHITPVGQQAWSIMSRNARLVLHGDTGTPNELAISFGTAADPIWRINLASSTGMFGTGLYTTVLKDSLSKLPDEPWIRDNTNNTGEHLPLIARTLRILLERSNGVPVPPEGIKLPQDNRAVSAAIFEVLTAASRKIDSHFWTKDMRTIPVRDNLLAIWSSPNLAYAETYALDWSIPLNANPKRPFIATRLQYTRKGSGKRVVQLACWDGTIVDVPVTPNVFSINDNAHSAEYSVDDITTDIFSPIGGIDHHQIGQGDTKNAWLR